MGTLADGADTLSSGLATLADGTSQAYDGSNTLSDGLQQLADSVDGMDQKVLDKLQDTIDEKLGRGYKLHSFVDPANTDVNEVEFVYVVSGVSKPDDTTGASSDDSASTSSDQGGQSFLDRLAALFSHDRQDD